MSGMLWFDSSKLDLIEKLKRAAAYYQKKYGLPAQVVLVSQKTLALAGPADFSALPFVVSPYPLPLFHFCAARDETPKYVELMNGKHE